MEQGIRHGALAVVTAGLILLSMMPSSAARELDVHFKDGNDFLPDRITAEPGESLTIHFINDGFALHSFSLFTERNPTVPLDDEMELRAYNATHGKLLDVWLKGGEEDIVPFTAPTENGTYVYVCMVPGHTVGGMHGVLVVGEEPTGIEPVVVGVLVGLLAAVAGGAILAIVRRRRS